MPKGRTVAIVQARMNSSRLPKKVMKPIAGRPMLWHVVKRASRAEGIDKVVVATSIHRSDDGVERYCRSIGAACFRGSEEDVLDRYYRAARAFRAETVVRLTADCPLIDPAVVAKTVRAFHASKADYVSNRITPTYPDGQDTEVFRFAALARAWERADLRSEREHVTPYIYGHPRMFRIANVAHGEDLSGLRWTVDEPEDLEFVRGVFKRAGRLFFGMEEVLKVERRYPGLKKLNAGIRRDEGYRKSLREDRRVR